MAVERGHVYGRLSVVGVIPGRVSGSERVVYCRCECGGRAFVKSGNLRSGHTKSCGCYRREFRKTHGNAAGYVQSPEYRTWAHMIGRCENRNFEQYGDYGGRGITVCERWRESFENFLADMGPRPSPKHSIDRIDNDGNYEPGNCRWATRKEQNFNRRNTRRITYDGVSRTLHEWSEITGINIEALASRFKRGWSAERMLQLKAEA